jgi:hypothetical protein
VSGRQEERGLCITQCSGLIFGGDSMIERVVVQVHNHDHIVGSLELFTTVLMFVLDAYSVLFILLSCCFSWPPPEKS